MKTPPPLKSLIIFQFIMLLFQMLVRYFTLIMLAVGQLNFLSKLLMEEQRSENTAVGRLAHWHDYPGTDAGQQEGLDSVQQEGD